jgi:integrase
MLKSEALRRGPGTSMASTSASTFRGVLWRDHRRGTQVHPKTRRRGDWWISWKCRHGHRHREKIGPKSLAKEEYGRRRTQVRREGFCLSAPRPERPVPFDDIVADYIHYERAHNRHPQNDCFRIGYWRDRWKTRSVADITRQDVEAAKLELVTARDPKRTPGRHARRTRYRPATVNRYLAALRCCFNVAIRNGKARTNPVVGTRFLKENNTRLKYLPPRAESYLLEALGEGRYRQMVIVAIHTGLRWSEQMGLQWRECDLANGVLTVLRSKHGEARHVPMNTMVRSVLVSLAGERTPDGEAYVFAAPGESPPRQAGKWFYRAVNAARTRLAKEGHTDDAQRLDGFTWHCLRHTFASRLAMASVDLLVIKELGGWKTLSMVSRYAHLAPGRLREGIERLVTGEPALQVEREASGTRSGTGRRRPERGRR